MKKRYSKPLLAYESFQLTAELAGSCNLTLNHYSYSCAADGTGQGLGISQSGVFYDFDRCQFDLTGPELDGADSMCYHGPMFTDGQVFMAS